MLLSLIEFNFNNRYFSFNNQFFRQLDGSAMGNPSSPVLAAIVMNFIIQEAVNSLPLTIPFLKLYVDDTVLAIPEGTQDMVLSTFNKMHPKIQFTYELEKDRSIPFLDARLHRDENNVITTEWYRKPSSSSTMLNYNSHHTLSQKRATISNLFYRIHKINHPQFLQKNITIAKQLLRLNNYPAKFINKQLSNFHQKQSSASFTDNSQKTFYKFPFITNLSYPITKIIKRDNLHLAYYNLKTTKSMYTKLKDKTPQDQQSSVVYIIPCSKCDKSYIGQTKQYVKKRIQQHVYDCKPSNIDSKDKTALTSHRFNDGHSFDFNNYKILDRETYSFERNLSEMIHIKMNKSINHRTDVANLSVTYSNLIHKWHTRNRKD